MLPRVSGVGWPIQSCERIALGPPIEQSAPTQSQRKGASLQFRLRAPRAKSCDAIRLDACWCSSLACRVQTSTNKQAHQAWTRSKPLANLGQIAKSTHRGSQHTQFNLLSRIVMSSGRASYLLDMASMEPRHFSASTTLRTLYYEYWVVAGVLSRVRNPLAEVRHIPNLVKWLSITSWPAGALFLNPRLARNLFIVPERRCHVRV
jgi:hypothetical protein